MNTKQWIHLQEGGKKNKQTTVSNEEQFVYCDNVLWSSGLVWWHSHSHSHSHSGLVSACGHTHSLGRLLSETVTTINMRPCQDYTHWDNQITLSHVTPWFKPFAAVDILQILREMSKPWKLYYTALVQHNLYINKKCFWECDIYKSLIQWETSSSRVSTWQLTPAFQNTYG